MADKGILYVVAAPSGAGKTTLVTSLTESLTNITVSISHTTREKRPGEKNGVNYYFVDKAKFEDLIKKGEFLEFATIFDNYYGTSKKWVDDTLAKGTDVILEIDWQGHQQIKKLFPDAISIFILPPSLKILKKRLVERNQDSLETVHKRLADAKETISHIGEFNYLIVNDDFEFAVHDLCCIIEAGRLNTKRQAAKFQEKIVELS